MAARTKQRTEEKIVEITGGGTVERWLTCEKCGEVIARFYVGGVTRPVRGEMFFSKDLEHGFPDPFPPGSSWMDFRCPYGPHRPFNFFPVNTKEDALGPDRLMTTVGVCMLPSANAMDMEGNGDDGA